VTVVATRAVGLLRAAHAGPTLAVTVLSGLLAVTLDLPPSRVLLVLAAVLTGQLSVGWSNDLVDAPRDRQVRRADKPLVTGAVGDRDVRRACAVAVVACVPLSLACGLVAGSVHLACVASAWGYNLWLKSTVWSWAPYAFSFSGLVVFIALAGDDGHLPPAWMPVAAGLLGVGAHLVNVLPDLADDAATGVRGLPHRLGERPTRLAATAVLGAASVVAAAGTGLGVATWAGLGAVALLAVVAVVGRGRLPFAAAIAIALVDVLMLVLA
jgi:4-hydroxybenzoate polyprenyltransferase